MRKLFLMIIVIGAITAVSVPIGVSYAKEFTMFGNTFDENSECAEWGLKYFQAISEKPYNLDQVQPQMILSQKACDGNPP